MHAVCSLNRIASRRVQNAMTGRHRGSALSSRLLLSISNSLLRLIPYCHDIQIFPRRAYCGMPGTFGL